MRKKVVFHLVDHSSIENKERETLRERKKEQKKCELGQRSCSSESAACARSVCI